MSLSTTVDAMRAMSATLGMPGDVHETLSGRQCVTHDIELVWVSTRTLAGWQGHDVCPNHAEGGCRYDGTTALEASEKPQAVIDAEAAEAAERDRVAQENAITINITVD